MGKKRSAATRAKISASKMGKKKTAATRAKMRASPKGDKFEVKAYGYMRNDPGQPFLKAVIKSEEEARSFLNGVHEDYVMWQE